jgi:sugar lactone lactonase YvrE
MKSFSRLLVLAVLVSPAFSQEKGGGNETGPYDVVVGWPKKQATHVGWTWGSTGGIFAESPDRIWIAQRGELPLPEGAEPGAIAGAPGAPATGGKLRWQNLIMVIDGEGNLVESWTQWDKSFEGGRGPHKIKISPYDPERHVWIVDDNLHQIFKFTHDGKKLVMTLGERLVPGADEKHFSRPTDLAWLPDGTFFVSDGYVGTRVVKFDQDGKYLMSWGKPGKAPGEFNLPHAIAVGPDRRVYVSDRSNSRIQVFDENGKHLDSWPNIRSPFSLHMAKDGNLWVSDGATNKILKYDLTGKLLYSWGTWGQFPGGLWGVHSFDVDADGNLYVAEVYNGRAQKFRPKKGADPSTLVGRGLPLAASSN